MPRLTEEELAAMMQRNPKLCVREMGGASTENNARVRKLTRQIAEQVAPKEHPTKGNKYRNKKVFIYPDGTVAKGEQIPSKGKPETVFDSVKEYEHWNALLVLERAGVIQGLQRQVPILIAAAATVYGGEKIRKIEYKADFMYTKDGLTIVEDVKPFDKKTGKHLLTKDFALKWKLLKAAHKDWAFRLV